MITDIILNFAIFGITAVILIRYFSKKAKWAPDQIRKVFRFFTVQSNVLCAAVSLLTAVALLSGPVPEWIWMLLSLRPRGLVSRVFPLR